MKLKATATAVPGPACTIANMTGGTAAMIDPMVGMKLSSMANKPHSNGKSTPKTHKITVTTTPVAMLTLVLMAM